MKSDTSLKRRIKNLAKRSQLMVRLYDWFIFFKPILGKGLLNLGKDIGKTRLFLTIRPYTMNDFLTLSTLYELSCRLEKERISGSFVECGVYKGGSGAIFAAVAKQNVNRHVWLFDSWEGFPEPGERDLDFPSKHERILGAEEKVRDILFRQLQLDSARVHLVKGWFADTLPRKEIGTIALLHLNCDLYESTKHCLEQLYDDVIKGGCITITDYRLFKGSEEAVNEFIERRNLKVKLIEYGKYGTYFYKES